MKTKEELADEYSQWGMHKGDKDMLTVTVEYLARQEKQSFIAGHESRDAEVEGLKNAIDIHLDSIVALNKEYQRTKDELGKLADWLISGCTEEEKTLWLAEQDHWAALIKP